MKAPGLRHDIALSAKSGPSNQEWALTTLDWLRSRKVLLPRRGKGVDSCTYLGKCLLFIGVYSLHIAMHRAGYRSFSHPLLKDVELAGIDSPYVIKLIANAWGDKGHNDVVEFLRVGEFHHNVFHYARRIDLPDGKLDRCIYRVLCEIDSAENVDAGLAANPHFIAFADSYMRFDSPPDEAEADAGQVQVEEPADDGIGLNELAALLTDKRIGSW